MKFRNLAVASVAALAVLGAATVAAAQEPAMQVHQRKLLRVAMSVAIGQSPVEAAAIARVVDQLWSPEGVDIEWVNETQAAAEDRLDAWVVIERNGSESSHVPAREHNVGRRVVVVSMDEVMARFEQTMSVQLQVSRESARHMMFGNAHLIERSLGYALAHKLGHVVMGLPHATTGLMRADYNPAPGLTSLHGSDLDAESRRLLQKRFGVGCIAAR